MTGKDIKRQWNVPLHVGTGSHGVVIHCTSSNTHTWSLLHLTLLSYNMGVQLNIYKIQISINMLNSRLAGHPEIEI